MMQYYKNRIWDILLCIALSIGLVFHIDSGFLLEDRLSASVPATILLVAIVVLLLFLFASSKIMTMIGIVTGVVLLVIFLIYVRIAHPFAEEAANSLGITVTILILSTLLTFLATRTRAGTIVLFLIGNLILAGSCFLQFPVKTWAFLLFVLAACMMFLYRIYVISLQQVHTGKVRMQRYMTQTLGVCLTAFVVAAVAFFGVVRPLNPPTRELKLITRLENMQLLAVLGVSTVKELPDPELISSWISQGLLFSSEVGCPKTTRA
ncbi:MAG: hypothetical protein LUF92_00365 [Clostridiales bacterium]|nr:hypothetical protein [Clostridiales bacterium]